MTKIKQICQTCKTKTCDAILIGVTKRKDGTEKERFMCNPCNAKRRKKYYAKNKEKCRAILNKSISKHKLKQSARKKVRYAIKTGVLVKLNHCESCGESGQLDGHHEDYSKPLEVLWLCRTCHAKTHNERKTERGKIGKEQFFHNLRRAL